MHGFYRLVFGRAGALGVLCGGVVALAAPLHAEGQDIVNIVNFIRGIEPRSNVNLIEPVQRQLHLAEKHKLPTTWLIQYDALINPQFTDLLKQQMGPNDEVGAWIEVVQPQVEAAGLTWRGRFPWDWHVNVGFTQGYSVEDRKKVMDVYMAKFHEVFGYYPKSAGCWIIDAPTLNYLHDQYGVEAACNCKDQSGTDGYTLWGGYWNQAYYPSRLNAYMPAQTAEQQLNVPVFRMLGSDPVHQYDQGIGSTWQGVVTLEPIYRPGGGDPKWVSWFFDTNFNKPSLGFSYMQAGQENSFGWPAMAAGLTDQYAKLAALRNQGEIRVETLKDSGIWFRQKYQKTPATSVVALNDSAGDAKRSIWYESRFYRVNLYWEGNNWRIRDLHVFNEDYAERYLKSRETTAVATYDTLPVLDGFHWSLPGSIAGIYPVSGASSQPVATTGVPSVTELGEDSLQVSCALASGGQLVIRCDPDQLRFQMEGASAPADWSLDMTWASGRTTSVAGVSEHAIGYQHQGFPYTLQCGESVVTRNSGANRISIADAGGAVTFSFDPDKATAFWDGNGAQPGAGGASPSGAWNDSALKWNAAPDGSGAVVAWPGADHAAVFSAGDDATGPYTVNVQGVQEAVSLEAKSGQVTLSGGEIRLNHPAILRAESGAGLTVNSTFSGSSGFVLQGEGNLRLGGLIGISGPGYISASALTLEPRTSFPNLSRLGIGRSVPVNLANAVITASGPLEAEDGAVLSLANTKLTLAGRIGLTGAQLNATGQTKVQAERLLLSGGDAEPGVSLGGTAELALTGAGTNGVFELNAGKLDLSDSALLQSRWFANRGEDASVVIAGSARLILSERLVLGDAGGAAVHVTQNGGSVSNTGTENNPSAGSLANRWGHWPDAPTTYEIHSGSLNLTGAPLYLSWDSPATLDVSGTASVSLKGVEMGWGGRNSSSLLRMNGGELKIGSHGIVGGSAGSKVVEFQGGKLGSLAAWTSAMAMAVPGALTVDTSGGDINLTGSLTGNGSLTKVGTGTLALSGPNQVAGGAAVEGGRLRLTGSSELDVVVGPAGNLATGGATIASLRLSRGATLEFEVGGVERSLTVAEAAGLALNGVHRVRIRPQAGIGPGTYPLLHYSGAPTGTGNFELIETPGLEASVVLDTVNAVLKLVVVTTNASSARE